MSEYKKPSLDDELPAVGYEMRCNRAGRLISQLTRPLYSKKKSKKKSKKDKGMQPLTGASLIVPGRHPCNCMGT